jgi:hypothetical protein
VAVLFGAIALHALVLFILKNENELIFFIFFPISVFCKKKTNLFSSKSATLYMCCHLSKTNGYSQIDRRTAATYFRDVSIGHPRAERTSKRKQLNRM